MKSAEELKVAAKVVAVPWHWGDRLSLIGHTEYVAWLTPASHTRWKKWAKWKNARTTSMRLRSKLIRCCWKRTVVDFLRSVTGLEQADIAPKSRLPP